jgi:hypothetical protein
VVRGDHDRHPVDTKHVRDPVLARDDVVFVDPDRRPWIRMHGNPLPPCARPPSATSTVSQGGVKGEPALLTCQPSRFEMGSCLNARLRAGGKVGSTNDPPPRRASNGQGRRSRVWRGDVRRCRRCARDRSLWRHGPNLSNESDRGEPRLVVPRLLDRRHVRRDVWGYVPIRAITTHADIAIAAKGFGVSTWTLFPFLIVPALALSRHFLFTMAPRSVEALAGCSDARRALLITMTGYWFFAFFGGDGTDGGYGLVSQLLAIVSKYVLFPVWVMGAHAARRPSRRSE